MTGALLVVAFCALVCAWSAAESRRARRTILALLRNGCELSGLRLVEASSGQLARGTVYVHLHRLEELGLVRSRERVDGRRVYKATDAALRVGRREAGLASWE